MDVKFILWMEIGLKNHKKHVILISGAVVQICDKMGSLLCAIAPKAAEESGK